MSITLLCLFLLDFGAPSLVILFAIWRRFLTSWMAICWVYVGDENLWASSSIVY